MNNGEPDIAILLAVYGCIFVVALGVQLFISYLLFLGAKALPESYRSQVSPGQAFLMLIPLFNLVWIFIYTKQLSQAYQSYMASINQGPQDDCGEQMGMWWGICSVASIIPCVGGIAGIAGLVIMIIYLIKVHECKKIALQVGDAGAGYGQQPQGQEGGWSFDQQGPDENNPYRP